jgi:hypothetical protein
MTGIHADWLTEPQKIRIVVVSTFALALTVRALAGFLVQRLLDMNRKKRNLRYRIPLALAHSRRSWASAGSGDEPMRGTPGRDSGATISRSAP